MEKWKRTCGALPLPPVCPGGASCRSFKLDRLSFCWRSRIHVRGPYGLETVGWSSAETDYLPGPLPWAADSSRVWPPLIGLWTPGNWHNSWNVWVLSNNYRLITWGSYHHGDHLHWGESWAWVRLQKLLGTWPWPAHHLSACSIQTDEWRASTLGCKSATGVWLSIRVDSAGWRAQTLSDGGSCCSATACRHDDRAPNFSDLRRTLNSNMKYLGFLVFVYLNL